jgi:hypothetical protein
VTSSMALSFSYRRWTEEPPGVDRPEEVDPVSDLTGFSISSMVASCVSRSACQAGASVGTSRFWSTEWMSIRHLHKGAYLKNESEYLAEQGSTTRAVAF